MKVPYPHHLDKTPIVVTITDGIDGNGSPKVVATYEGRCRMHETSRYDRDPDGKLVRVEGKVFIGCDIAPSVRSLEGHVEVFGRKMNIYKASRPRNPDGSIHHTKLELI